MEAEQVRYSNDMCIPDPLLKEANICGKWVGSDLSIHASLRNKSDTLSMKNTYSSHEINIYHLASNVTLFHPVMRKLINESCCNFLSGQSLKNMPISACRPELIKLSRKYRSIIRACMDDLQETSSPSNTDSELNKIIVGILYKVEFMWHLTEILHVESVPGDAVIPLLVEWLNLHFPEAQKTAIDIINNNKLNREIAVNGIESKYSEYWDVVIKLVLQGNLDLVRSLLKLHSAADTDMFVEADKALRQMPKFSMCEAISMSEYINPWKGWHATVKDQIQMGLFSSEKNLESVMKIIIGDVSMAPRVRQYCGTWYKYMIVTLLYSEPTVKSYDLRYHAHQCISQYGGTSRMNLSDTIMLALLNSDFRQVVNSFQLTSDCGWTAAHMTNLLRLCGKLNFDTASGTASTVTSCRKMGTLEEKLLLEYGSLLMKHQSLWQVGIRYLDCCPTSGLAYIEAFLSSMPLNTEAKAMKVIDVAQERGLSNVVDKICKVQGQKCLHYDQLGNALTWAIRSQNSAFASHIADKFLHEYGDLGFFKSPDVLGSLGSCMLLCDRLTFLGKYYECRELLTAEKYKEAASLLCQLLESKLAPKYFWLPLLLDAFSLLECETELLFSSSETQMLICRLEELLNGKHVTPAFRKKVHGFHIGLAKYLARTFTNDLCNDRTISSGFVFNS